MCCRRSIGSSPNLSILVWSKIQRQLWKDMERVRLEFERIVHAELRTVRQRSFDRAFGRARACRWTTPLSPRSFGERRNTSKAASSSTWTAFEEYGK